MDEDEVHHVTSAAGGRQCLPRSCGGARAAELEAAPAPLQRRGQVLGRPPLRQVRAASSLSCSHGSRTGKNLCMQSLKFHNHGEGPY